MTTPTTRYPPTLLQALKKGEVIVIAGTGVSASVAGSNPLIRSWPALLRHGVEFCCDRCHDANDISDQCRLFDASRSASLDELLTIGDEIQDYLNKNDLMEEWLEVVFGGISPEDQRLIRAISKLHIPIATTNYDRLFEDITGMPGISWRDTAKLHKFLNGNEQAILHLHGHFRDPKSIILGKKSYDDLLEAEFVQFAEQVLFSRYNVLFVGFGDSTKDPNFSRLLSWSRKYLSATQVFRIARDEELDKLREEHKALGYTIQLIGYEGSYPALIPFLEDLAYELPEVPPIPANLSEGCPDNVGRGALIETVVDYLVKPVGKPIALLGGGGIGKTNTVLNVLFHRRTAIFFGERRYFVRCDGATTADLFWAKTLDTLGIRPTADQKPQEQVETFLAKQPAVLVLDNAETCFNYFSAAFESILLRLKTLSSLKLVVTYRGKAVPGTKMGWLPIPVLTLTDEQAKALFLNITGDQFADDPALPGLLREVDHLPLAVTLLAERAKDYNTIGDLARKWRQKRTDLLKLDPANKDLNLEVSVLLSFDSPRLTTASRELFKALCWLPDGLDRQTWEAAFPDNEDDQTMLLRAALAEEDSNGRVRVLAPVREVISRKFGTDAGWLEQTIRHLLTAVSATGRRVAEEAGAYKVIQTEWTNLTTVFTEYDYTEWLIDALTDLTLFSQFTGQYLTAFLEKASLIADENQWSLLQAYCLKSLGDVAFQRSDNAKAIDYFGQALPLYKQVGAVLGKANCLKSLGDVAFQQSDNEKGNSLYEEAILLYKRIGNKYSVGRAYYLWSNHQTDDAKRQQMRCKAKKAFESASMFDWIDRLGLTDACP